MTPPLAGIVAFNPGPNLVALCASLRDQGCPVVVYDNGSSRGLEHLDECAAHGATVIRAEANTGVAGGLSALLDCAAGYEWLLTFDQDSCAPDGFVAALTECPALSDPQAAIIAPRVVERASGDTVQGHHQDSWHRVDRTITSGALCRVSALTAVGGFREELFIDYVDYDLCLRLRRDGWFFVVEPRAVLHHSIGAQTAPRLLGLIPMNTSNHSPDRVYYKYRNYMLLWRDRTWRADRRAAVLDGAALLWGPLKIALLERGRRAKLAAIAAGVRDGFHGRTGRRPS